MCAGDKEPVTDKQKFKINFDNVAVPEVHTGQIHSEEGKDNKTTVTYDNLAIPEVHFKK